MPLCPSALLRRWFLTRGPPKIAKRTRMASPSGKELHDRQRDPQALSFWRRYASERVRSEIHPPPNRRVP